MEKERRRYSGRQLVLFGAILLIVWAGYECYIRLDMLVWWFNGITRLCASEGIPFTRAVTYFDAAMFNLTAYLAVLVLFAVAAIILRNRPMGDYAILGLCVGAAAAGGTWVNLFSLSVFDWAQTLKLVPMALIAIGCVINISQFYARKRRGNRPPDEPPRDITRMNNRELARQVKKYKKNDTTAA